MFDKKQKAFNNHFLNEKYNFSFVKLYMHFLYSLCTEFERPFHCKLRVALLTFTPGPRPHKTMYCQ